MSKRLLKRILWICCTAAGVILVCHVFLAYDSGLEVFPIEDSGRDTVPNSVSEIGE